MPSAEVDKMKNPTTWAEQMEEHGDDYDTNHLPPKTEVIKGNQKIVTEYKYNEQGKKVKVVRTYSIEVRKVPKCIARRKNWKKFGLAASDSPGPNPATTIISEDIFMQFVGTREDDQLGGIENDDDALNKLKSSGKGMVQCRYCGLDHWTLKCPYKEKLGELKEASGPSNQDAAASSRTTVCIINIFIILTNVLFFRLMKKENQRNMYHQI